MAETVGEFGGAALKFAEDAFDGVPILVCFMLELEAVPAECRPQPRRGIDEQQCISDEMFLA